MRKTYNNVPRSVFASTGDTKYLPELATRLKNTSVSVIKEMMYLGAVEQSKGKSIISLGVGLPFYPAPKHIHDYVKKILDQKKDIDKYTLLTGLPELRSIIAKIISDNLGIPTTPDEILITPGSMAALFYSILALVNPDDEVILPSPFFSSHAEQISIAGGKVVPVPMIEDRKLGYRLNIPLIKKAINKKTKAIVINNPQNPTGTVYAKIDLIALAEILQKTNVYLIVDEVYDYLVYDNIEYFNISGIKKLWPKVIRCCSLSKKYGIMGWRIGYLHTNRNLLMNILKIHDANIVCAPHISQEAAIAALTGPQNIVKDHVKWLSQNRSVICKRLDALPDLFSYIIPKGAYYVFPKYNLDISSIDMAKRLLYEAGVVSVPGIGFGREGEYHLRFSYGSDISDINGAFDRIEKWWGKQIKYKK